MKPALKFVVSLMTVSCGGLCAFGQIQVPSLRIGNPAPQLEVSRWLKGNPVSSFDKGQLYVVEFWATWCVPCRQTIPHLSELQHKYGTSVKFIGVESFEQDWTKGDDFVKSMGSKMEFAVGVDRTSAPTNPVGETAKNWAHAAGESTIPVAFVVDRNSRITWIGNPIEIDSALDQIVAGTWSSETFARNRDSARQAAQEKADQTKTLTDKFKAAMAAKSWGNAIAAADELARMGDDEAPLASSMRADALTTAGDISLSVANGNRYVASAADVLQTYASAAKPEHRAAAEQGVSGIETSLADQLTTAKKAKLDVLLKVGDLDGFATYAKQLASGADRDSVGVLDHIAWLVGGPEPRLNDAIQRSAIAAKYPFGQLVGYTNPPQFPEGTARATLLPFARQCIERAVQLTHRKSDNCLDTLGWVLYSSGDRAKAAAVEKESALLSPAINFSHRSGIWISRWFETGGSPKLQPGDDH